MARYYRILWKSLHFDGEYFARQGVILVTINYRLNILGRMTHPELSAEAWALLLKRQKAASVYVYCLNRQLPGDQMGAFHAPDLWYVFEIFFRGRRP